MSDWREAKQCDVCRLLYTVADLEEIFTGRTKHVCYKCIKNGRQQTGSVLRHKAMKAEKTRK